MIMKQRILAKDKKIIISGLKTGTFNITELNHLTRELRIIPETLSYSVKLRLP